MKRIFWKQPPGGFDEQSCGLTEEQLAAKEREIGVSFPAAYRQLMMRQNGGTLRHQLIDAEAPGAISDFEAFRFDELYVNHFLDYMLLTKDETEIAESEEALGEFHPKRLVVFSHAGAFGVYCFDYGWRQSQPLLKPKIVFASADGNQFLHYSIREVAADFDALLNGPHEATDAFYFGIRTKLPFDEALEKLGQSLDINLTQKSDDRYGHFNFDHYYLADLPLYVDDAAIQDYIDNRANSELADAADVRAWFESEGRRRTIRSICSPNQHRSGTWLFADDADCNIVLEVPARVWFDHSRALKSLAGELRTLPFVEDIRLLDGPEGFSI